jgi:diguanylate cyclase (GGDEF)-like protein
MTLSPTGSIVLIYSRDARIRQTLVARVTACGCQPILTRTVRQTVLRVARQPVDAVICHVAGSDRCARRLLHEIRQRKSNACILLLGHDLGADRVARLLRSGAFDYLRLPLRRRRFEGALAEGLDVRQSFIQVQKLSASLQRMNQQLAQDRDRLRRWNRDLRQLNRLGQTIAGTLDAERIALMAGTLLEGMLSFQRAAIVWFQPERVWIHEPHRDAADRPSRETPEQLSEFFLARAHLAARELEGGSLSLTDAAGAPRIESAPEILEMPLSVADQPLGLLHVARNPNSSFDAHERELMQAVATSLALALRNADVHSQVQKLALRDPLTGLLNRRALSNILTRRFRETERYGTPLSLIMLDLDYFKEVNDRFGHPAGDALLKSVARLLGRSVRTVDVVARYGGEEFAIVLPGTHLPHALVLADRVRQAVAQHKFVVDGTAVRLTCSMGIARIPNPQVTALEHLIGAADRALYQAKSRGRNRVEAMEEGDLISSPEPLAGDIGIERLGGRC